MPFGLKLVDSGRFKEACIRLSACWCHLTITTELSICASDAAFLSNYFGRLFVYAIKLPNAVTYDWVETRRAQSASLAWIGGVLLLLIGRIAVPRPCYKWSSVICLSICLPVCHSSEPRKNEQTPDRDTVWVVDSSGLKEACIRTQEWLHGLCDWTVSSEHLLSFVPSLLFLFGSVQRTKLAVRQAHVNTLCSKEVPQTTKLMAVTP